MQRLAVGARDAALNGATSYSGWQFAYVPPIVAAVASMLPELHA